MIRLAAPSLFSIDFALPFVFLLGLLGLFLAFALYLLRFFLALLLLLELAL